MVAAPAPRWGQRCVRRWHEFAESPRRVRSCCLGGTVRPFTRDHTDASTSLTAADRRQAAERELAEVARSRLRVLNLLKSPDHAPKDRIRLWEQVFGLHLPHSADHALVREVAKQTQLSIEIVQTEQARRRTEREALKTEKTQAQTPSATTP